MLLGKGAWMRRILAGLAVALLLGADLALPAESLVPGECEVKVAFIYNFIKFTEWPAGAFPGEKAALVLCRIGTEGCSGTLQVLNGLPAQGREIAVRTCAQPTDVEACHVLFVEDRERSRLVQLLSSTRNRWILTIGDAEGFARLGGVINFIRTENRLQFEVNVDAASRARLEISSQVLALARIIQER